MIRAQNTRARLAHVAPLLLATVTSVNCDSPKDQNPRPRSPSTNAKPDITPRAADTISQASDQAAVAARQATPSPDAFDFRLGTANRATIGPKGSSGSYSLTASHIALDLGPARLQFRRGEWSNCVEEADEVLPGDREHFVQWYLSGEPGTIAARLDATSITLRAVDESGCLRVRDLTEALTGAVGDDALLSAGANDLEGANDRIVVERENATSKLTSVIPGLNFTETSKGISISGPHGSLQVSFPAPRPGSFQQRVVVAREAGTAWIRFETASEREDASRDEVTATESSLVVRLSDDKVEVPFASDRAFASRGRESEDSREQVTRWVSFPAGELEISTEMASYDAAKNIGVGKCPEMEGLVDIGWERTSTKWSWRTSEGERLLAATSRERLDVPACRDAVLPAARRGFDRISDDIPSSAFRWHEQSAGESVVSQQ